MLKLMKNKYKEAIYDELNTLEKQKLFYERQYEIAINDFQRKVNLDLKLEVQGHICILKQILRRAER